MDDSTRQRIIPHIVCFLLCLAYSGYLAYRAHHYSNDASDKLFPPIAIVSPAIYFSVGFCLALGLLSRYSSKVTNVIENTYVHFPTTWFVLTTIVNYGVTLHYSYWKVNPINPKFIATGNTTTPCASLTIPSGDLALLQLGVPMLVLIQVIYFWADGRRSSYLKFVSFISNSLNTMDIMDLVTDVGCIQSHSGMYKFFYIVEFLSVIVIPFSLDPRGIEEKEDDATTSNNESKTKQRDNNKSKVDKERDRRFTLIWRLVLLILTTLFADVFPLIIRSYIMTKDKTHSGVNFVVKEAVSVLLYMWMIRDTYRELRKMSISSKQDAADKVLKALS